MVTPITEAASVIISREIIKKDPQSTASNSVDGDHSRIIGARGEVRKSEINDGILTVKVYDSNGKLLRKIPPGYLPLGELKFDITI